MDLADRKCVPCRGGVPPLDEDAVRSLHLEIPEWEVLDSRKLRRSFDTGDFAAALVLVNKIGALAEEQWHHPDLYLGWGRVTIELWTHKIDGLSESDFILAAKIDRLTQGG